VTSNDEYVLQILRDKEMVTPDQVDAALNAINKPGTSVVDSLIENDFLLESDILSVLAQELGMEVIDLEDMDISADVRSVITEETARKYKVIPVYKTEETLTIALGDPLDFDSLDSLRYMLKYNVEAVVAPRSQIQAMLNKYYASESSVENALDDLAEGTVDVAVAGTEDTGAEGAEADAPIIKLCSLIIMEAFRNRASDIHLEPLEKRFRVRYRIDGVLHEVDSPPKRLQPAIISRYKIMSNMKISEKRIPQDGRIQVNVLGKELDLRVSSVPTNHGESIVMRILDKTSLSLGLPKLGFFSDDQQTFERIISSADGVLLVTGPTGSGKSTTLYACLNEINKPDRKIITVEDPVEYQLSGVNQVQVRSDIGLTFSAALRSILRQAPNIVMIGEIRDIETANIATEAALTGHLVFSTLHTNDAPSAVTRLLDIGVKPFLVASALRAVQAQRLVRCICENCREEHEPTETERGVLMGIADPGAEIKVFKGRGCNKCNLTGYKGRKGIFEIFLLSDDIQKMIFNKEGAVQLRQKARESGMRTLREDGLRKVLAGVTTMDEVVRTTMGDAD